jgi:GH25 family lysozyme M1 (1,4-beta-N-acetylmuramidase)
MTWLKLAWAPVLLLLSGADGLGQPAGDPKVDFSTRELRSILQSPAGALGTPSVPFVLDANTPSFGGMFGVDVSHWDTDCDHCNRCVIDWKKVLQQQVHFAYVKATTGVTHGPDPAFAAYWSGLLLFHQAGTIYRGAFHWLTSDPSESGIEQAKHFLQLVRADDKQLPPAVDVEEDPVYRTKEYAASHPNSCRASSRAGGTVYICDGWVDVPQDQMFSKIKDWLNTIGTASHRKPIIYTRSNYWADMLGKAGAGAELVAGYSVWLAQYPTDSLHWHDAHSSNSWRMPDLPENASYPPHTPAGKYSAGHFWQFSETGRAKDPVVSCSGVPEPDRNIDLDWFPSSAADFEKALGVAPDQP